MGLGQHLSEIHANPDRCYPSSRVTVINSSILHIRNISVNTVEGNKKKYRITSKHCVVFHSIYSKEKTS